MRRLTVLLGVFAAGAAAVLCQPGETSVSCCIRKFPLSPMESCAATEAEALKVLIGLKLAYEAARAAVDCMNEGWMGSCYQCLRYCEGQQEWPFNQCRKRRKANP